MMPRLQTALTLLLAVAAAGCGDRDDDRKVVRRPGNPDMVYVKPDDGKMEAAIGRARATVDQFIAALQSPKPGDQGFAIKKPFAIQEKGQEHIWLSNVTYDGKLFHGRVNNEPVDAKKVKLGDPATVSPAEISDWMFVRNGKLVGGQTILVFYDLKSPAGRKKFEAETGLKAD